jgi:hypothetical protein
LCASLILGNNWGKKCGAIVKILGNKVGNFGTKLGTHKKTWGTCLEHQNPKKIEPPSFPYRYSLLTWVHEQKINEIHQKNIFRDDTFAKFIINKNSKNSQYIIHGFQIDHQQKPRFLPPYEFFSKIKKINKIKVIFIVIGFITTTFNTTPMVFYEYKIPKILVLQSYVQYHHKK